jgi:hypothetical protein
MPRRTHQLQLNLPQKTYHKETHYQETCHQETHHQKSYHQEANDKKTYDEKTGWLELESDRSSINPFSASEFRDN